MSSDLIEKACVSEVAGLAERQVSGPSHSKKTGSPTLCQPTLRVVSEWGAAR